MYACDKGAVTWNYPDPEIGRGVKWNFGWGLFDFYTSNQASFYCQQNVIFRYWLRNYLGCCYKSPAWKQISNWI